MQHFYDGQIRRYIVQITRFFSNFAVKYADGTLVRVPVMYGDEDRQVASIIRGNSENKINSAPRIAVYVSGLDLDTSRLGDATYVGKVHVRERSTEIDPDTGRPYYTNRQGENYTVERLMPTPFKLTVKVDLWTTSTDQKLQLLEQILVLFNPSIELQTTDNYLDWTSLSTLTLDQTIFTSRSVPVGADSPIDIATLTFSTPIWISPPAKVKQLGVITNIIMTVFDGIGAGAGTYIEGLGVDPNLDTNRVPAGTQLTRVSVGVGDYGLIVYNKPPEANDPIRYGMAKLLAATEAVLPPRNSFDISNKTGPEINWRQLFEQHPGQYRPGFSIIRLLQPNGSEVIGTIALLPDGSETVLTVNWDQDTYPSDTDIITTGDREAGGGRSTGTFDAIIDPSKVYPGHGMTGETAGDRFLIVEDIGPGTEAWGNFTAFANDIIEWDGSNWNVIFDSAQEADTMIWQTNIYTGVQYMWNGVSWVKSFEGEYRAGSWSLEL
jgi:hypothetical protein